MIATKDLDVTEITLSGVHLIEASAGTGKTFTITSLVLRLLVEQELPLDKILAVTFTNAATAELKERVGARIAEALAVLSEERKSGGDPVYERLLALPDRKRAVRLLRQACGDADRSAIFTIHGFAARVLTENPFETGARPDAELVGDERALVTDVVTDFWSARIATLPASQFEYLGGSSFYRILLSVGQRAAGAEGVPLVLLGPELDLEEAEADLQDSFEIARAAFAEHGAELRQLLLTAKALNRQKYALPALEKNFLEYQRYFLEGVAGKGHPDTQRLTQSKVNESVNKGHIVPTHPLLSLLETLRDDYQRVQLAALQMANRFRRELCEIVRGKTEQEHQRENTQSFDGLLRDLGAALRVPERGQALASTLRKNYPVALIDEFQDTDPLQYEIFQRIYVPNLPPGDSSGGSDHFGRTALYLIGDPKQSIYAFRGADVHTYLAAASGNLRGRYTLGTSYRAGPSLVRAQNALFSMQKDAFALPGIAYHPVVCRPLRQDELLTAAGESLPGMNLLVVPHRKVEEWLKATADEVARFLSSGHTLKGRPVLPKDIAVLTRTNKQAQTLQKYLWRLKIPAVMHGDRSVLESDEAVELRRILLAMAEPGHRLLVRTALATRLLGLGARELAALDENFTELELWTARLRRSGELWRTRGIAHAMETLQAEVQAVARTLSELDGERRLTNLRHLLEILHEVESTEHLGIAGLLSWLEGALADPNGHSMASEARQLRLESDADAVTLTTAHKSKGLEYEIVFLPSVGFPERPWSEEAFRYFDEARASTLFEMRSKETRGESEEWRKNAAYQESLRLGYVAFTRACHHVVVLVGASKGFSSLDYWLYASAAGEQLGPDEFAASFEKLKPEARARALESLFQKSEGAITQETWQDVPVPEYAPLREQLQLSPPPAVSKLAEQERTSSFSAMTRDGHRVLTRAAREGRDVDEVDSNREDGLNSRASDERAVLADVPRGAKAGDALHNTLEKMPFFEGTAEERALVIARELGRRGFEPSQIEAVQEGYELVLRTPLDKPGGASMSLGALDFESRVAEMEFSLPIGLTKEARRLSSTRLAVCLGYEERHPNAPSAVDSERASVGSSDDFRLSDAYLERVAHLQFSAWSGFLRGFIDLVYVWNGKLYGVDYKSNHLGDRYSDYTEGAMGNAMEQHHYYLQALLYAVAIHRYGKQRLPGYTYETHFGGMQYLFLRGMSGAPMSGVHSFRPTARMVLALSDALDGVEVGTAVPANSQLEVTQ